MFESVVVFELDISGQSVDISGGQSDNGLLLSRADGSDEEHRRAVSCLPFEVSRHFHYVFAADAVASEASDERSHHSQQVIGGAALESGDDKHTIGTGIRG